MSDTEAFGACVEQSAYAQWAGQIDGAASSMGVSGTPTLHINGAEVELPSTAQDLRQAVEDAAG